MIPYFTIRAEKTKPCTRPGAGSGAFGLVASATRMGSEGSGTSRNDGVGDGDRSSASMWLVCPQLPLHPRDEPLPRSKLSIAQSKPLTPTVTACLQVSMAA